MSIAVETGLVDVVDVDDPADPRLDDFRDLNSVDRRPDLPSGKGLVIAEGVLVVQRMLASRFRPRALLGTDRRLAELRADLEGLGVPYYRVSAEVMADVVGFHLNRGVLASASRAAELTVPQVIETATTVAVLEGVNDHENLGSIFRNAAGLGVGAAADDERVDADRGRDARPRLPGLDREGGADPRAHRVAARPSRRGARAAAGLPDGGRRRGRDPL